MRKQIGLIMLAALLPLFCTVGCFSAEPELSRQTQETKQKMLQKMPLATANPMPKSGGKKDNQNSDSKNGKKQIDLSIDIGEGAKPLSAPTEVKAGGYAFCIEADPHWDDKADEDLFSMTLNTISSTNPDFLIDLGDTAMTEKLCKTQEEVFTRYAFIKKQFEPLGSIPLYMVLGNHDGENGWNKKDDMNIWSRQARIDTFPPHTDMENFTGNTTQATYYSFTKGEVQFIILDPYSYTTEKISRSGNGWSATLGKDQYLWLKQTLECSTAKWKMVFIHNLAGGLGKDQRGGAEAAALYEWGGHNDQGVYEFDAMRPTWSEPIHDLFVKHGVSVVFHGHDHFYGKQEKDGLIYQLVPQPATPGNSVSSANDYGYITGTFFPSPGFLRVVVNSDTATVEYWFKQDDGSFKIVDSYNLN